MVVFGGDENVGVERGNFLAPSLRVGLAVLMHPRWYGLIEERELVILDVDNLKLRVFAAFQDVVHPLCDRRDKALSDEMDAFGQAAARSATRSVIEQAFAQGFQQRSDIELNLGAWVGRVVNNPGTLATR